MKINKQKNKKINFEKNVTHLNAICKTELRIGSRAEKIRCTNPADHSRVKK